MILILNYRTLLFNKSLTQFNEMTNKKRQNKIILLMFNCGKEEVVYIVRCQ